MSNFTTLTFGPPSAESTVVPYTDEITDPTVVPWSEVPFERWLNAY